MGRSAGHTGPAGTDQFPACPALLAMPDLSFPSPKDVYMLTFLLPILLHCDFLSLVCCGTLAGNGTETSEMALSRKKV